MLKVRVLRVGKAGIGGVSVVGVVQALTTALNQVRQSCQVQAMGMLHKMLYGYA
jgi:hypothetical protein